MKNSGIEWIGEIPDSWRLSRVKYLFYISKTKAHVKNPTILKLARSGVQIRDISSNEGQLAESYEDYNPVAPEDLLLNPMDLYSGANCNMSEISGVISPAYVNLRKRTEINSKFFDYFFKCQYWTMAMFAHGKGISFDNRWTINADTILNYEIPLPPYDIQNSIVEAIKMGIAKVDKLIEIQQAQIEKLKEYKQSVITEAVTKGIDPNVPMKDSGVEWIGKVPEQWKIVPLKSFFSFGKGLPITKENLKEDGVAVISYGQIHAKWNSGVTVHEELKRFVSEDFLCSNPQALVKLGDFIFADTSEDREGCGNCVYIDTNEKIFAGYHTIIISGKRSSKNKYLAYLFLTEAWRSQIRKRVTGVKLFSISKKILAETTILIPNNATVIVSYLDDKCSKIDKLIEIKQAKIEKLQEYKKSLIYEYVTGKKEVV